MDFTPYDILLCIGDHEARVGEILMPMYVMARLNVSIIQAQIMLSELEANGYLTSNGDGIKWHLTQQAVDTLNNRHG